MFPRLAMVVAFILPWQVAEPAKGSPGTDSSAEPAALVGLWPSPNLTNLLLRRWADELGHHYDLEEGQQEKLGQAVVERWTPFLAENRAKIQPLVNEFVEMQFGMEPPSETQVKAWAERALPLLNQFREQIDQATDDVRSMLGPMQRIKLEVDAAGFGVGMQIAETHLQNWQDGKFESQRFSKVFWRPTAAERSRRKAERRLREEESAGATAREAAPLDPILAELKLWEEFVGDFIRLYELTEGQRSAAFSFLSELKLRAINYRAHRRGDIDRLELSISTFSGSEEDLSILKKQLTRLYGPVDDMFNELKTRLEKLPTAQQRAATAAMAPGQPKPADKAMPDKPSPEPDLHGPEQDEGPNPR